MKRYLILLIYIVAITFKSSGQTLVTAPLNQPNTTGVYYSPVSITLSDGFSTAGNFHAYIAKAPLENCVPLAASLSKNLNYIVAYTPRKPFVFGVDLSTKNTCEVMQSVQYFDGLGRLLQKIQVKGNPDATKDLVQSFEYDNYGRESRKYLPFTVDKSDGSYSLGTTTIPLGVYKFYNPAGSTESQLANGLPRIKNPFAETRFEASPLGRATEQSSPGEAWDLSQGHTIRSQYLFNTSNEVIRYTAILASGSTYKMTLGYGVAIDPNTLFKTIVKDENWQDSDGLAGTIEEFKDKDGHVILKRTYNKKDGQIETLSTSYVYDDFGNLSFVLPPFNYGSPGESLPPGTYSKPTQQQLDDIAYQYRYDQKNRLIEKKLPGKGWEYMIYNEFDQLVMTQDALQRNHNDQDWLVTKYDKFSRVVVSGLYKHAGSTSGTDYRDLMQKRIDSVPPNSNDRWESYTGQADGYTILGQYKSFPLTLNRHLAVNYYDNYNFQGVTGLPSQGTVSTMTKGLITGVKTYTTDGTAAYLAVNYYDEGRIIQALAQNQVGGLDRIVSTYNFSGELLSTIRTHTGYNKMTTIAQNYEYDHMGRQRQTTESINAAIPVILSRLTYNEIGQLRARELHSNNEGAIFLNKTTYTYNARGWLKDQANPLFNMGLKYEDGAIPQYNGNISRQEWGPLATPSLHNYTYTYDKLNRLTNGTSDEGFNEVINYDRVGNITGLSRNPMGTNTYLYNGNQLSSISGFINGTYLYDVNGNMISDGPKNISIAYNYLNLPVTISKQGAAMENTWLANGIKLKKAVGGLTREYAGGIEYNNGVIEFIQTGEGRARPNGSSYFYEYMLKDHLGNTRVLFDQNGTVLESSDYYPFGLQVARAGNTVPSPENRYKYNGKELQTELGLMQYDYGARFYDPVIGRWNVIDPKAEDYDRFSPYNYVTNNPINLVDPDGTSVEDGPHYLASTYVGGDGKIIKHINDGDRNIYFVPDASKWNGEKQNLSIIGREREGVNYNEYVGRSLSQTPFDRTRVQLRGENQKEQLSLMVGVLSQFGPQGISQSFALDGILSPHLSAYLAFINILELIGNSNIKNLSAVYMKGERNQAGSAGGTNNPFKKLKPDPDRPGNVLERDSNGTTRSKVAPEGFKEWWNVKHPDKKI